MDAPINLASVEELLSVQGRLLLEETSPSIVSRHLDNGVSLNFSYEFSSLVRESSRSISSEIIARRLTLLM